jgi:hypothetical protein
MTRDFDLVICAIERDIPTLEIGLPYMRKYLCPARIVIIAPRSCYSALASLGDKTGAACELILIDEDLLVEGLDKDYVSSLLVARSANLRRSGWYFQQFLKLCYSLNPAASDYYLVWDADTIPLRPMKFFGETGKVIFEKSKEYNPSYFITLQKLIGKDKTYDYSFISEHMMMESSMVRELLKLICTPDSVTPREVARRIIAAVDAETLSASGFSEFETYGTFAASTSPDRYELRSLRSLRQGTVLFGRQPTTKNLFALSHRYWWVSFEAWPISTCRAKIKRRAGRLIGSIWTAAAVRFDGTAYKAFLDETEAAAQ